MRSIIKKIMTLVVVVIAFAMTGSISDAAEAVYTPAKVTDVQRMPEMTFRTAIIPVESSVVIPIKIPSKGGIWLYHSYQGYDLHGKIYEDASCTIVHDSTDITEYSKSSWYPDMRRGDIEFEKAGTYYLKLENGHDYGQGTISISMAAFFFDGTDRDVQSGRTYASYRLHNESFTLYKFKANKTGYLNVDPTEIKGSYVYVKLLDSNKRELSDTIATVKDDSYKGVGVQTTSRRDYVKIEKASFGVQKGKIYYIAVLSAFKGPYESGEYNIKFTLKGVKEKSGGKKSDAVTIKRNTTVKGTQIVNGKKNGSDWYKIKLTRKQKVKFCVKGDTTGSHSGLKINIVPADKKHQKYKMTFSIPKNGTETITTAKKLPKGIYYIQVFKSDKRANGYYTIKWK